MVKLNINKYILIMEIKPANNRHVHGLMNYSKYEKYINFVLKLGNISLKKPERHVKNIK